MQKVFLMGLLAMAVICSGSFSSSPNDRSGLDQRPPSTGGELRSGKNRVLGSVESKVKVWDEKVAQLHSETSLAGASVPQREQIISQMESRLSEIRSDILELKGADTLTDVTAIRDRINGKFEDLNSEAKRVTAE